MEKFTIVAMLSQGDTVFLHHEAQSWQAAETDMRVLGVSPVLVLKGFAQAADGRKAYSLREWRESNGC